MDDGSTDGSLDLARDVLDPRVRLIPDGRRKGLPHRLNEIAERAGGTCHRACKSPHLWALNHWIERIKKVGGLYLGAGEESRLNAIYNLAEVFVMPTRAYEMFGMAAVEAQVCGKPVVSSDSGCLKEVVPSNCGARFPVGDSATMADEIEKLVDDSNLYAACSANALINAATYDWARICDTCDELYRAAG